VNAWLLLLWLLPAAAPAKALPGAAEDRAPAALLLLVLSANRVLLSSEPAAMLLLLAAPGNVRPSWPCDSRAK
jgi:hypothetical protein